MKRTILLLLLCFQLPCLYAFQLHNFSKDGIDYQWDRKDQQDEALRIYVASFQASYIELGLGDCAEHFKEQVVREKELAAEHPLHNRWLVALDGEKVVGMAIFELDHYPHIYIRELAILPAYRRRGIGSELSMALLKDHPISKISILTRRANTPAILFYQSLGFKESNYTHEGYDVNRYIGMEWERL